MDLYLGRNLGDDERLLYPAKHLTTHGLIFGMTGSGKTGLAIDMLEEAQRQGVPVIAIDPKGDLTNLALAWPGLDAGRFGEWLDPARLDGSSPAELGATYADTWGRGLERDGLGGDDIAAMRDRAHLTIYTPGSTSGVPVSLLRELAAPEGFEALCEEDRQELVSGVVGAILSLVQVSADPLQSREFILLSNIVSGAWEKGESLDLPTLVQRVDAPGFSKLGVFDIDEFFPPRRRRDFAMQLNGLIASPSFKAWLEGPSIDLERMLERVDGRQRTSVFYLAHLDDSERMSFVTLLLERIIAWMRRQPGTGHLRALIYMDEVFGYLPPHPLNPPSKRPIMTLLKQARAFGVGLVLATQNPVDVDYKALTNAGTWMIGKLQAERDRERVLDGLMSATSGGQAPTRAEISRLVTALEGRQFVLQSAHEPGPRVFRTRFAMSFLRGPMTRQEVARLRDAEFYNPKEVTAQLGAASTPPAPQPTAPTPPAPAPIPPAPVVEASFAPPPPISPTPPPGPSPTVEAGWSATAPPPRPALALPQRFLSRGARSSPEVITALGLGAEGGEGWTPALYGEVEVSLPVEGRAEPLRVTLRRVAWPLGDRALNSPWRGIEVPLFFDEVASYAGPAPTWLSDEGEVRKARELLERSALGPQILHLPACPPLGLWGQPGEPLETFRTRTASLIAAARDRSLDKATHRKDHQEALLDRQVKELRELLEADQRELGFLRERGDADGLRRATGRVQVRMERFRELQAARDKFVGLAQRDMADIEFSALDKLEATAMHRLQATPKIALVQTFALLWIPRAPL